MSPLVDRRAYFARSRACEPLILLRLMVGEKRDSNLRNRRSVAEFEPFAGMNSKVV